MYIGLNNLGLSGQSSGEFAFSPTQLFTNGVVGAWYNFGNRATLFSDTDGTIPAEVDGTVAYIRDLSGNGVHLTQSTAGSRATLRSDGTLYWLEFDGLDDYYTEQTMTMVGSQITQVSAVRCTNDAGEVGNILDGGTPTAAERIIHGAMTNTNWRLFAGSASTQSPALSRTADDHTLFARFEGASSSLEVDGGSNINTGNPGVGTMKGLTIAVDPVTFSNQIYKGRIYGLLAINRYLTDDEKSDVVNYFNTLAGL